MYYTNTRRGFTLIELLVVVLIIGILAAVAVPQYQVAVAKSRYARMKPIVNSIVQAQEAYYLAHGNHTLDLTEIDVSLPEGWTPGDEVEKKMAYWPGKLMCLIGEIAELGQMHLPVVFLLMMYLCSLKNIIHQGKALGVVLHSLRI